MIHFIHSRGHAFELQQVKETPLAPATRMMDYDRLFKKNGLPFSAYIFTDLERLGFWDLELAGQVFAELQKAGLKVLNNPARAKNRFNLLRRSEEHTSELQSLTNLVCRLLLEK